MNKTINPAPLGLVGFGMSTILLNLHNVGLIPLSVVIISIGIMLGGFAQLLAGILEFKIGNTFGGVVYLAYGLFWLSLVTIWTEGANVGIADNISMGFYLLLWAVFTLGMSFATLKHSRLTQVIFFMLTLVFVLLAVADFTMISWIKVTAGVFGLICGILALYSGIAQIINGEFKKEIFKV
ncbi:MAG TPA: acetate uptake transporter [Acholeplasma sp.]|jgi:succinate-acetate transporter protein